jgi:hypothetical protein
MVNFAFSTIRYQFEALTKMDVPYFLGSSFRGIMGKRLKKTVCIKPFEECEKCEFRKTCPYSVIFETEITLNKPSKYVLKPPFEKRKLKAGESIYLEITLLGETSNYWEFISGSLIGKISLGKDKLLKLKEIYFYHPFEDKYYPVKSFVPTFEVKDFFNLKNSPEHLKIKLFPSSIKANNKIVKASEFDKDIFVKAVISRISNIAKNYGTKDEKIFIDKNLFDISSLQLKPSPMKRWSNRKKKKMTIPAFEGSVELVGNLNQIFPYLKIIEVVNIGKSVSFGLGRVKLLNEK